MIQFHGIFDDINQRIEPSENHQETLLQYAARSQNRSLANTFNFPIIKNIVILIAENKSTTLKNKSYRYAIKGEDIIFYDENDNVFDISDINYRPILGSYNFDDIN